MAKFLDLTGRRFKHLVVLEQDPGHKRVCWKCKCDCGREVVVQSNNLMSGNSTSCGCICGAIGTVGSRDTEYMRHINVKCEKSLDDPLYIAWGRMKTRCGNNTEKRSAYKDRGIYVDDVWKYDFSAFKEWSLKNGWRAGLSLDRINNDGPYSPDNCRWTDSFTQMNNTRTNHFIEYNGERHTIAEWSRIKGIAWGTLAKRIEAGWTGERLFSKVREYRSK